MPSRAAAPLGALWMLLPLATGCTQDAAPIPAAHATPASAAASAADRPGVKPHYVKCDPAHPELPCTPDSPPVKLERATPPGVKPHYVKCDPAHPELPCTPDLPVALAPGLPRDNTVTALGGGRSEAEIRGCKTDSDCALSCQEDGRCCPTLCECDLAYNRTFLAELTAHQAHCTLRGCAKAKCADPGYTLAPVCTAGLCGAKRVPYPQE